MLSDDPCKLQETLPAAVLLSSSRTLQERLQALGVTVPVDYSEGTRVDRKVFGYLLALDLYDCPQEVLESLEVGYQFLEQLVAELNMVAQSPPFIFLSDAKKYPDKAGLSGWVPLIESGITLHTLLPTSFATIDVYSCKYVPPAETIAFAHRFFRPGKIEATYLYRGRSYPAKQVGKE